VTNLVAWLRQVFAALNVDDARVAGSSYGGWLAANLGAHAPELVSRLVLLAPAATLAPIVRVFRPVLVRTLQAAERPRQHPEGMTSSADPPAFRIVILLGWRADITS
jgi:pimeloyl-ACP methyl ester carboxylesterase